MKLRGWGKQEHKDMSGMMRAKRKRLSERQRAMVLREASMFSGKDLEEMTWSRDPKKMESTGFIHSRVIFLLILM